LGTLRSHSDPHPSLRSCRLGAWLRAHRIPACRKGGPHPMTDVASTASNTTTARSRNPLAFLQGEIDELKAKGLYRRLRVVQSEQRSRCVIDGREVITLSSNNYLGLNTHPRLRRAAIEAVERYGAGSGAVRTIAGTMSLHE